MRRRCRASALLALIACAALPAPAQARDLRPDVVVIETDDQTVADMAALPRTRRLIGDRGVTFERSIVSLSQCCPSRATFLTGRYAHNHRVLSAQPPFGGEPAFDPRETLAVWLQRAGYRTALVGKYLNGYGLDRPQAVPPGWTDWRAFQGPSTYQYERFGVNVNGAVRTVNAYKTDWQTAQAQDVLRGFAKDARPFFLWLTYVAPHAGDPLDVFTHLTRAGPILRAAVPSPLHVWSATLLGMPPAPAFDEADVSDKPAGIRRRPRLGHRARAAVAASWRRRQEALRSVDIGVQRVMDTLRAEGRLENTLVLFTSDNGFLLGEHRVAHGKALAYEPSIQVPLLLRGPGVPAGGRRTRLVWNGDLAPTIAEAARARAPWPFDGESLWPTVRGDAARADRAVLLQGPPQGRLDVRPQFTGVRVPGAVYIRHLSGERELYDLRRDPHQLDNLAGRPGAGRLEHRLSARLAALRGCAGTACRRP